MRAATGVDHSQERECQVRGTVIAVQANFYQVKLDRDQDTIPKAYPQATLLCTRRTRLKKIGQQVMVGDCVVIEEPDWAGGRGAISQVLPRQTELNRPPIANANHILIVFAIAEPDLEPLALSRFLVKAESTGLEVSLCLNKCDLVSPQTLEHWHNRLSDWGYPPLLISVRTLQGLTLWEPLPSEAQDSVRSLPQQLKERITVISGPSGVGKSSLINALIPSLNLRVGEVSGKLGRGRHTTRHVELFELPGGGLLADTPGFNQPTLDCTPEALAQDFPEIRERLAQASCQFTDCRHRDEPNCVVRGNWERYPHYLEFLAEAIQRQEALQQLGGLESSLKLKSKSEGRRQYEPKLETKKYRRSSRRVEHQTLQQDMSQDLEEW